MIFSIDSREFSYPWCIFNSSQELQPIKYISEKKNILLCCLLDKLAFQDSNQEKNNRVDLKVKI